MTVGDRALGQQAPRLAGGSKDDDLQDSTHGLDGSSRSLGGTVDADEGGPHARSGQVPDQKQVDQEGDRVFVTARDDGDHVRSQGHNREEDRDLPGLPPTSHRRSSRVASRNERNERAAKRTKMIEVAMKYVVRSK